MTWSWCIVIAFGMCFQASYNGQKEKSMTPYIPHLLKCNVPECIIFHFWASIFVKKLRKYNRLFNYFLAYHTSKEEKHIAVFTKGELALMYLQVILQEYSEWRISWCSKALDLNPLLMDSTTYCLARFVKSSQIFSIPF